MRSRVSDKKRRIIIISSIIITFVMIGLIVWKLVPFTRSLHLDFTNVKLDCTNVTVLSDGNFAQALSDGTLPKELVTDEVEKTIKNSDAELCVIWLEYTINSEKELDTSGFSVDLKPMSNAQGKLYSYIPVTEVQKDGDMYVFRQAFLIDKVDVRNFLLEGELPRRFRGFIDFELSYVLSGTNKVKRVGFDTE